MIKLVDNKFESLTKKKKEAHKMIETQMQNRKRERVSLGPIQKASSCVPGFGAR